MSADVKINFKVSGADQVARVLSSVSASANRAFQASAREQAKISRETLRAQGDVARQRVKLELEAARQVNRIRTENHRSNLAMLRDEAREQSRLAARQAREQARIVSERQRAMRGVVGGVVGGVVRGGNMVVERTGRVVSRLGSDLAAGAGLDFSLQNGLRKRMSLEKQAVDLSNSGFQAGAAGPAGNRVAKADLMRDALKVGNSTATDPEQALAGLAGFTKVTGDLATGRAVLEDMAKLSRATGGNLDEMVAAAGEVAKSMGDAAKSEDEAQKKAKVIYETMKALAGQGKLGAVEIADFAKHGGRLASAANAFEGNTPENVVKMGFLAQEARGGGGAWNAATAAGAVSGIATTLMNPSRRKEFESRGIKLEGAGGKIRDPLAIISEAIDKTGGDMAALNPMFKNVVGARAMTGLANKYLEASGGKKDDASRAAGRAAVTSEINRLTKGASMGDKEVNDSFAASMDTLEAKARIFQNRIEQIAGDLAEKVIPAFMRVAPTVEKIIPIFDRFVNAVLPHAPKLAASFERLVPVIDTATKAVTEIVGWAANNPELSAGLVILANAGQGLLSASFSLAASGVSLQTAAARMGAAAAVMASLMAGFYAGTKINDEISKGDKKARNTLDEDIANATTLASKVRSGVATPEEIKKAQELQGRLDEQSKNDAGGKFVQGAMAGAKGLANGEVNVANIASLLPIIAAGRGIVTAADGATGKANAEGAKGGAEELAAALASRINKPVEIGNSESLASAIGNEFRSALASIRLQLPGAPSVD